MKKAFFLIPFFFFACATQEDLSRLEYRVIRAEQKIEGLERAQRQTAEDLRDTKRRLQIALSIEQELENLKKELYALRDDHREKAEALQDLFMRLQEAERELKTLKEAKVSPPPPPKHETRQLPQDPDELYHMAYEAFKKGDYDQSLELFQGFLNKFPQHELAGNAQFWVGECHYRKGDYERAILEYEKVLTNYPKSAKVPAALLKQGFAFLALGNVKTGTYLLERVISQYPSSPEADLARQRLSQIRSVTPTR